MHSYDDSILHAGLDAITARAGNGAKFRFYTGTQPAKGAATSETLLAEGTCGTPFAPAASGSALTVNSITFGNALASGDAGWFRVVQSDGTTFVYDAPISDASLNRTSFTAGQPVDITSYIIRAPA